MTLTADQIRVANAEIDAIDELLAQVKAGSPVIAELEAKRASWVETLQCRKPTQGRGICILYAGHAGRHSIWG